MVDLGQKKVNSRSPFFILYTLENPQKQHLFFEFSIKIYPVFQALNNVINLLSQFMGRLSKKFNF